MPIKVEVFSSPGCSKCAHAKDVLRKLVDEMGVDKIEWREVNILNDLDHAVALGVLSTPAIAIDDTLVFTSLPTVNKLRSELKSKLGDK